MRRGRAPSEDRLVASTGRFGPYGFEEPVSLTRRYTRVSQAAEENAWSRVLVGFHFPRAAAVGLDHGTAIGERVVRRALQPRR